jgi:hypothetical protein
MKISSRSLTRVDVCAAAFALAAIALHDANHVLAGRYWDVFWVCNVAAILVGPAILLRSPLLSAAALTWLVPGTVVWLLDVLAFGSNIIWTSYAVHFGGTAAAVYATRRSGLHRRGWAAALATLAFAVLVSRLFLPASANVNAAHGVPRGWGFLGANALTFAASATVLVALACWLGRALGKRIAR